MSRTPGILRSAAWLSLLLFTASPASAAPEERRPNIILIMADDMGWSDLGCYGGEIRTPHIDSMAERGLRFTQFYNNAVCGPTRVSLLTGLYPQQVGHSGRSWNQPKDFSRCATIAELLQGYHRMMVGKWQGRDLAVKRGFDRFFGPNCQAKVSYFHEVVQNEFYLNDRPWAFPETGFYLTDAFNDYSVQFLKEAVRQEQPFFLYLAHIAPHWPLHAPEEYIAEYRQQYLEKGWDEWRRIRLEKQIADGLLPPGTPLAPIPASIRPWANDPHQAWQAERMAVYAAQIARIDHGVGQILELLRKANAEDNTVVLFLSDNGAAPDGGLKPTQSGFGFGPNGRKEPWRIDGGKIKGGSGPGHLPGPPDTFAGYGLAWALTGNSPFRNTKLTAFEGGIRTPLVVQWPKVIREGGQITRQPGHVIDFMATCLDLAGQTYPAEFQGRKLLPLEGQSLVPVFQGKQREGHSQLCWSAPRNQAIRRGDWKLVNEARGKPWQLYNLAEDPTETANLAAKHPDRVQSLSQAFHRWHQQAWKDSGKK